MVLSSDPCPNASTFSITNKNPMLIATVASACAPVVKIGELAEIAPGLNRELEFCDITAGVARTRYACMRHVPINSLSIARGIFRFSGFKGQLPCSVWSEDTLDRYRFFTEPDAGDKSCNHDVRPLKQQLNDNPDCRLEIGYNA